MIIKNSIILVVSNIDNTLSQILPALPKHNTRIVRNKEEGKTEFRILHAQQTIKEAYLASSETKYIILCGSTFRTEAQNSLLKILEEPPKNIVFILITQSKSSILPTILSRMPHKILKERVDIEEFPIDLVTIDLRQTYNFLKEHQRISKNDAKELIEAIVYKIQIQNIKLNEEQLKSISDGIKLINLNSRPLNVITNILLHISNR